MKLSEKLRSLREAEGRRRGMGRAMTQGEVLRALDEEAGRTLSQSYLSQIETGSRPHLTNTTRKLLAGFFKVHPGYLVDDPEDGSFHPSPGPRLPEEKLDEWLTNGAERFHKDPELRRALLTLANHEDSRRCLILLETLLKSAEPCESLIHLLRPQVRPADDAVTSRAEAEPTVSRAREAHFSSTGGLS